MKSRHAPAFPLSDMKWVFYDFFIIEHRQSHAVWFAANGQTMPAEALIAQMEEKSGLAFRKNRSRILTKIANMP